jgi:hypothetical protein
MAIPSSGPLSLRATIANEVDGVATNTDVSLRTLSFTAGKTSPDKMSEFYNYTSGPGVLLDTISPDGTGTTFTFSGNYSLTSYAGQSRRLVLQYTSGTGETGDFQIHSVDFNGTMYGPTSNIHSPLIQTSRTSETNYSSVTFYNISTGQVNDRWNVRNGSNTPTTGTGISTYANPTYISYSSPTYQHYIGYGYGWTTFHTIVTNFNNGYRYFYAETSGTSASTPNKEHWLRTPATTIVSGRNASFYYVGKGATVGTLKVWLV